MELEFKKLDENKGWASLYQQIRSESNQFDYSIKEAKKVENKNLNRYRDVSPYDHSRVKLQNGGNDYINASFLEVQDAKRAYILTQGPLPNTTAHFWQMVWEQNSKAVLMLNKVIEKNTVKCHQYWPLGSQRDGDEVMELTKAGLRVEFVSENEASHYTVRHLKLTDIESGTSRIVFHFHYTTWPDFCVPKSPSAFLNFLFAVRESGALDDNVGPPVVHCSAGIGRSGTFCLVDSCLVLIEKYGDLNAIDVKQILLDMRKYRMGLIQTFDQLRFSYLAILEGSKRVLKPIRVIKRPPCPDSDSESEPSDDESSNDVSRSSADLTNNSANHDEPVPPLPPKRRRVSSTGNGEDDDDTEVNSQINFRESFDCCPASEESPMHNNNSAKDGSEDNHRTELNNTQKCSMTMKDGAVVPNFGEKLREAELRQRLRKEKNEKLREKVKEIQQKQKNSEKWNRGRSLLKPISVSLILLLGGGYLVYRYFWK